MLVLIPFKVIICLKRNLEIPHAAKYVVAMGEFYEIELFPLPSLSVWGSGSFCYLAGLALNSHFERVSDRSLFKARLLMCILQPLQKDDR